MSFSDDFDDILERSVRLSDLTTFGIGGPAEFLARPRSRAELSLLLAAVAEAGMRLGVLGCGSNILAADEGVAGVVVTLAGREFASQEELPGRMRCGAGVSLGRLVRECMTAGLSGVEGLAGIPATVGGALRMNAGGRYGTIGDLVVEIEAVDLGGEEVLVSPEQAGFGYRRSDLDGLVITACRLQLTPEDPAVVSERVGEVLREKRAAQPLGEKSAGCVFRNPTGGPSAGQLIEGLGLKGRRCGGAVVSSVHANYIVNAGGATCGDVLELMDLIREEARRERGVELELEVEIWS